MLNSSTLFGISKSLRPSLSKDDYVWFRVTISVSFGPSQLDMDLAQVSYS